MAVILHFFKGGFRLDTCRRRHAEGEDKTPVGEMVARFGLAVQDAYPHVVPREIESRLGPVDHDLVQPAFGLFTESQAMMDQGQEDGPLGIAPIATGLNALVQTTDGVRVPAGEVECRPEDRERIAPLPAPLWMPGRSASGPGIPRWLCRNCLS